MPTKAMDAKPELEFEFFLAQKLSMTVDEMRARMSASEFVGWGIYYARIAQNAELARLTGGGAK